MLGYFIQFQCFDMCQGMRVTKAGNWFKCSVYISIEDHIRSPQLTCCSVRKCDLQRSGADEASGAEDEFRSTLLVVVEIPVVPTRNHPALTFTNYVHINGEVSFGDTELFTSTKVRGNLRAVNDVLARQTDNIGTGPADVFALDDCDTLFLVGEGPGSDCSPPVPPPRITRSYSSNPPFRGG